MKAEKELSFEGIEEIKSNIKDKLVDLGKHLDVEHAGVVSMQINDILDTFAKLIEESGDANGSMNKALEYLDTVYAERMPKTSDKELTCNDDVPEVDVESLKEFYEMLVSTLQEYID